MYCRALSVYAQEPTEAPTLAEQIIADVFERLQGSVVDNGLLTQEALNAIREDVERAFENGSESGESLRNQVVTNVFDGLQTLVDNGLLTQQDLDEREASFFDYSGRRRLFANPDLATMDESMNNFLSTLEKHNRNSKRSFNKYSN